MAAGNSADTQYLLGQLLRSRGERPRRRRTAAERG
jgi:hypothetical protein